MSEAVKVDQTKTTDREAALIAKYNVRHHYRGTWKMDGDETLYDNKAEALKAAAAREVAEEVNSQTDDIIPEGYERYLVRETQLVRGSVMELPMNEMYDDDGALNPLYDREYVYAWAYQDRQDIASHRAKGYSPVDPKDFKRDVKDGKIPQFVGDLVYEEGSFIVYGDSVLMRTPRFLWRQRQREALVQNQKSLNMQQAVDTDFFRKHGVDIPADYVDRLGLQNSIDIVEV